MKAQDRSMPNERVFAGLWVLFFVLLALLAWWKPGGLVGAAIFTALAGSISLVFNGEVPRRTQARVALFPLGLVGLWGLAAVSPGASSAVAAGVGVLGGAAMVASPRLARGVKVFWTDAASPIGWSVSAVLLGVVYFLVITPIGVCMRLAGRDPMQRGFHAGPTYWEAREATEDRRRHYRQF
jgi:hypothetical protein